MRAAPAIQISLNRFGSWRAAVLALTLLGMLTVAGWLAGQAGLAAGAKGGAMATIAGLLLGLAVSLIKLPAVRLNWDGQCWTLGGVAPGRIERVVGEISVAVDLGPWMLLRFRPAASSRWSRLAQPNWLPVQRRGIEPQWHALRCAVYSPRPLAAADVPAAG